MLRNVGGLVFYPTKADFKKDTPIYLSVQDWIEAKGPDNVYIHDSIEVLLAAHLPIRDAVLHRGVYTRIPRVGLKSTEINRAGLKGLTKRHLCDTKSAKTVEGINVADTKEHHTMVY